MRPQDFTKTASGRLEKAAPGDWTFLPNALPQNVDKLIQQNILSETDPMRKSRRVFEAKEILNLLNADL